MWRKWIITYAWIDDVPMPIDSLTRMSMNSDAVSIIISILITFLEHFYTTEAVSVLNYWFISGHTSQMNENFRTTLNVSNSWRNHWIPERIAARLCDASSFVLSVSRLQRKQCTNVTYIFLYFLLIRSIQWWCLSSSKVSANVLYILFCTRTLEARALHSEVH